MEIIDFSMTGCGRVLSFANTEFDLFQLVKNLYFTRDKFHTDEYLRLNSPNFYQVFFRIGSVK